MFKKMPFILLAIIFLMVFAEKFIPLEIKQQVYSLSLFIKTLIVFILPLLIFMLLFKTISQLSKNATKMIVLILATVCVSNFISTMISYHVGSSIYNMDLSIAVPKDEMGLNAVWMIGLPKLIANDHAMFAGIILGLFSSFFMPVLALKASNIFDKIINVTLRVITLVIPIFISGFVLKLIHDGTLTNIVSDYSLIFLLVALSQFAYIAFIYLLANRFNVSQVFQNFKNMLPALITGLSTMSSAAAMPLTIIGTEKNTKNPTLTRLAIPVTVNTHLIGDCFAIPIFAFAVMKNFGMEHPAFYSYLIFAFFFVMAKFSVAAIPGGGILVMLPILESQLGFTAEMASLITALYILFDPVITCANVCGNGGFTLALNKLQNLFFKESYEQVDAPRNL